MKASEFANLVPACCSEVLDSMYFTTVLESTHPDTLALADGPEATAAPYIFSLSFKGEICGTFGIHADAATARSLAANFLGEDDTDLSPEEVGEVAGELANMLCGSVVSRVEGRGKFALSHPEALSSLPGLHEQDALISRLDTDTGVITTWVTVERKPCL